MFVKATFDIDATAHYLDCLARSSLNLDSSSTTLSSTSSTAAAAINNLSLIGEFETNNEKVIIFFYIKIVLSF